MPRRLEESEITFFLGQLKEWSREGLHIRKQYTFGTFTEAMSLVNRVAAMADKLDHHPDLLIQHEYVTLTLTTNSVGGLTELDFTLARMIDGGAPS